MSCCSAMANSFDLEEERLRAASRAIGSETMQSDFHVPGMHCIACVRRIEKRLHNLPFVSDARANLSTGRVRVTWSVISGNAQAISQAIAEEGFEHTVLQNGIAGADEDQAYQRHLLVCLGVAGFAAANVMLLSVSVWSGADAETRQLFHLISGLIALPAVMFAGQPFFKSALQSLAHRRLNMDVPISLAVILALAMSIRESLTGGEEAYFDAALMLLFFLLIGRTLDHMMRTRARSAVTLLSRLAAKGAVKLGADGSQRYVPVDRLQPGDRVFVAAGERLPVDGVVRGADGLIDRSLVTGESASITVKDGDTVEAGTINLAGPLHIEMTKASSESFLSEVIAMMEAAENGKARFVRLADRAAAVYAPAVHILALAAFAGWLIATDGDWHTATMTAVAVLIITCPCALGLAVPIVHVIGAGRLFDRGILIKDGSAFERLCEADTAVFDKTGTLTLGEPVVSAVNANRRQCALARSLAMASRHPAAQAIRTLAEDNTGPASEAITDVRETPGCGVEGLIGRRRVRLGAHHWTSEIARSGCDAPGPDATTVWLAEEDGEQACFELSDALRPGAEKTVAVLRKDGLETEVLSGDNIAVVRQTAQLLGVAVYRGEQMPADKIAHLERLQAAGRKVLMVGDGLNDAPALAASHVSMAPSSGSDVGRQAADFVLTGNSLEGVVFAREIAKRTDRLARQNIAIAIIYNCIAVPLALAGLVTPLVAAICMSASSVLVVANSMRLRRSPAPATSRVVEGAGLLIETETAT